MIRSSQHKPVYREVVMQAFSIAWRDKQYWILSILAGFLMTAGSYDILLKAVTSISTQGGMAFALAGKTLIERVAVLKTSGVDRVLFAMSGIEIVLVFALVIVVFATISCVAQGAIVYAIGARRRGEKPTVMESLRIGARALWPIIVLNALTFTALWILRFLPAMPLSLALQHTTYATYLTYLVSFIIFVPLAFFTAVIQIFALNAVILQGAPLGDALRRAYEVVRKNWLVVVETAALQVFLSVGIWMIFLVLMLFALLPIFVVLVTSAVFASVGLLTIALLAAVFLFIIGGIIAAAFTVQTQYAVWTLLYRRLGEGGVVPKIHRLFRSATGFFTIKG